MTGEIRLTVSALIKRDDTYLFVQNAKTKLWCLPSGKIEYKETPEKAIKREAREEMGRVVNVEGLLGIYQFISSRNNWVTNFTYICNFSGEPRIVRPQEISDLQWLTLNEIYNLHKNKEIQAGRAQLKPIEDYLNHERKLFPSDLIRISRK